MASCCTGVTECDQVITIKFLNSFIGSDVQNSSGVAQTAAGNDDYCPTYSELTGGTLIQNWKQGTTPNGDQDGIIIGGSYSGTQCVRRGDLSMKYTRFKEFTITAASTTLTACSASTTISYTHKYDRCERKINSDCEAAANDSCTAVNDTQNSEVTLTSSNANFTLDGFTVNVPKNNPSRNGRSNSRNTTITGKITFRGTDHTATVKITQSGLSGKYAYYYSDYSITNKRTVCTGSTFDCSGGDYKAQALHTRTDWDVYNWKDNCGENYYSDTSGTNYTSYTQTAYTYSGSFSDKSGECGTWEDSKSWAGYGTGCSWKQTCAECDCEDYTSWGEGTYSGTVPCSGGTVYMSNITIPGTIHYRHIDEETSACVETTTATSKSASTSVYISCNTDRTSKTHTGISNGIRYTITQSAGPCCTPDATTSYTPQYLSCSAHENEAVSSTYTARTTGECCTTTYKTGNTSTYYVTVGCNSGSTRVVESDAPFTIYQYGDTACCVTCKCENVNLNAQVTAAGSSIPASGYTNLTVIGTYNNSTCLSSITATSNSGFVTDISVSNGNVSAKVQQNTSTTDGRTATITVTGKDGFNADCPSTFTVTQSKSAITCTCNDLTVSPTSLTWDEYADPDSDSSKKTITITAQPCVTGIATGGTLSHFSATLNGSTITVQPNEWADEYDDIVETLKVTYNGSCTSSITLTHESIGCNCDHIWPHTVYETGIEAQTVGGSMNFFIDCHPDGGCAVEGDGSISFGKYKIVAETSGIKGFRADWCEDDFYVTLNAVSNETVDSYRVEFDGTTCFRAYIRRVCPCPCDNCSSTGVYEHPLYLDYAYRNYPSGGRATSPHEGDTIYVPTTSFSYNGTIIRGATTGTSTGDSETHYLKVTGGTVMTGTNHLQVGDVISGACGFMDILVRSSNYIDYYAYKNTGGNREGTVVFNVDAGTTISGSGTWRDGKAACGTVNVVIKQAGNGTKYRVCCKNRWTGYNERVIRNWDDSSLDGDFTNRYCDETPQCGV